MDEPTLLILGYWDMRGLAERVRLLLQYLSLPYQEEKFSGEQGRVKWFDQIKPKYLDKNPALTLPYLIDGNLVITESDAICVHLCHKAKPQLLGRSTDQIVAIAAVKDIFKELYPPYIKLVYGKYTGQLTFEQALQDSIYSSAYCLKKLAGVLADNQFIAGELTWIDFAIADFLQTLSILHQDFLNPLPKLVEYFKRVWGLPELKDYFESKRFRERPCNNYTATWK